MQKIWILFIVLLTGYNVRAQLLQVAQRSNHIMVYTITADSAEKYIKKGITDPESFENRNPIAVWDKDTMQVDSLPVGNYVMVSLVGHELLASYFCVSNIQLFPINNQRRVQLELRNGDGELITNAGVWVNGKAVKRMGTLPGFVLKQKYPDEAIVKVAIPGDTLFMQLEAREDVTTSIFKQRKENFFKYTKLGRTIIWPVNKVKKWVQGSRRYRGKRYKASKEGSGYIIFNKPEYKPLDTVKFKAYIINKKQKQLKKSLNVILAYYQNGKRVTNKLTTLQPASAGAYVHTFVLGDSLKSDQTYYLQFEDKKENVYLSGDFKIEDYLLDEVATYNVKADKKDYYRQDTITLTANAEDANGLAVMDGSVTVYLLKNNVTNIYEERLFVGDTIWQKEYKLESQGNTKISLPANSLPNADVNIKVKAVFKNSNNELQEKEITINYWAKNTTVHIEQENGWIKATYLEDGVAKPATAIMDNDVLRNPKTIQLPYSEKINPFTESYDFTIKNTAQATIAKSISVNSNYQLQFQYIHKPDTSGFTLYNPYNIPVHFIVYNGNKVVATGIDSVTNITWVKKLKTSVMYMVHWNYIWAGEEQKGSEKLAVLDKMLITEIKGKQVIYPGQKDTITIDVKDYKGRPAAGVNLTVASYNSQLGSKIKVTEPQYLKTYKLKRRLLFDNYGIEDVDFTNRFKIGEHKIWVNKFAADTTLYYRMLLPEKDYFLVRNKQIDFIPQVSVFATDNGMPQEIYLLYINNEMVWYNGTNTMLKKVYEVAPGYAKIGIRLKDKYIEKDSIYLQPYYKHDIVINVSDTNIRKRSVKRTAYYTVFERNDIENSILQLENHHDQNNGYLWQGHKLAYLGANGTHITGPFKKGYNIQFFKRGNFDISFPFEPGYRYRLSEKTSRLEKMPLFTPGKPAPLAIKNQVPYWVIADTLLAIPEVKHTFTNNNQAIYLRTTNTDYYTKAGKGTIQLYLPGDSSLLYGILYSLKNDSKKKEVKQYSINSYYNLTPGLYGIVLVTRSGYFSVVDSINVKDNATIYIKPNSLTYNKENSVVQQILDDYKNERNEEIKRERKWYEEQRLKEQKPGAINKPDGSATITGVITDAFGASPVVGVTVLLKGYNVSTLSKADGSFEIGNIKSGNYRIHFTAIGYLSIDTAIVVHENTIKKLNIAMTMSTNNLDEVVVVGYGLQKKSSLTGSISVVNSQELSSMLQGQVAGLQVSGNAGTASTIQIRGISALQLDNNALYVVDGIVMDKLPTDMNPNDITNAQIVKDAAAVSLYGARASNGVVIITTKNFAGPVLREAFRDYAFWQPNLITDKRGRVSFAVTYPDNITSWQTFVIGMDKKKRIIKTSTMVKAFKPLMVQLSAPQFLVQGDSAIAIGKVMNYTQQATAAAISFSMNKSNTIEQQVNIPANDALIVPLTIQTKDADTISATFSMIATEGFADGELRKIPVVEKGISESIGDFWILHDDTTLHYTKIPDSKVKIYAQNNTLDVLLDELEHLKRYPYFCMEQTSSKLRGLLAEEKITKMLNKPFKEAKQIQQLLAKLQGTQNFDGGWPWWKGGESNLYISAYVTRALLSFQEDVLVKTNLRNALLYLQNQLPILHKSELMEVLYTLSEANHLIDYVSPLRNIHFDSLPVHAQWQYVRVKQKQQLGHEKELQYLINHQNKTMLGGIYWGEANYYWQSNIMASSILAFETLANENAYTNILNGLLQYFLECRKDGKWRNTVESANIVAGILPYVLQKNANFTQPATLRVYVDEQATEYKQFPLNLTIHNGNNIRLSKQGGGMLYLTAWQNFQNKNPEPVTDKFIIKSHFSKDGRVIEQLRAGEKVTMKVNVQVLADAEYVQLTIPIPAGCTYADKKQDNRRIHKEYLKDKMVVFIERMSKGLYEYEIELEPRYNGKYILNPVKAELMYFPTFYGRNHMSDVNILSK